MPTNCCGLVLMLLVGLASFAWCWRQRLLRQSETTTVTATIQRLLKPRTPHDCPLCRQQLTAPATTTPTPPTVTPWRERKSRRGVPKRITTQGFACPNRRCTYYQISDAQLHALVGDGAHARTERIQTLRCQACGTTFSTRRGTPLYRLKTPSQRVGEVLTALAEGLDVSAAAHLFGYRHATITTWLTRAGIHSASLHDRIFQGLYLPHIQLDELRTRLRSRAHALWLWVAFDPLTKIIPVLHLGARTQAAAYTMVHGLRQQLAPACLPVFTSDGLNHYFYALTAHFGHWVVSIGRRKREWQVAAGLIYGQVKKVYRRRRLVRVSRVMRCGTRAALQVTLTNQGLSGRLNTAFVERVKKDGAPERCGPHGCSLSPWWIIPGRSS